MAKTKEDYLARIETALQDSAEKLQPDDKSRLLSQAVFLYSQDRPRKLIHEITGDGSAYDFVLPTSWVPGFSYLTSKIEYPADVYQDPAYIEDNEWMFFSKLVLTVTTMYIRFVTFIPELSKKARFEYALPHTLGDTTNTIPEVDIEAVVNLTTALCFLALAAKFNQSTDPTIEADVIDYQRKSDTYVALAKERMTLYNSLMGIGSESKGKAPASAGVVIKDLDIIYAHGEDYLTHPSSQR
jgi:hypothetical protein